MAEPAWPFVGTEALANGVVNRGRVGKRSPPSSPPPRCTGSLWIDAKLPAELNQRSRHKTKGIVLHSDELGDEKCASLAPCQRRHPHVRLLTSADATD